MTPEERFAANLVGLRRAAGLRQRDVSETSGIHRTRIAKIEQGKTFPTVRTMLRLAGACDVSVDDLLAGMEWDGRRIVVRAEP